MLVCRNKAVESTPIEITSSGAIVSFDTVEISTGHAELNSDENMILIKDPGYYHIRADFLLDNEATTVTHAMLTVMIDGEESETISGSLPTGSTNSIVYDNIIKVITSNSGYANIQFKLFGADDLNLTRSTCSVVKV